MHQQGFHVTAIVLISSIMAYAGPPVPFLDDNQPGINIPFSGDPNTTEDGCAQDAPRAGNNNTSGKMHNEFLECDNWSFSAVDWGKAAFLQGAFVLGSSPFSDDGGWECQANVFDPNNSDGAFAGSACVNSTVRVRSTARNSAELTPRNTENDWVFSFDFKIDVLAGDTFGNDKLFDLTSATVSPITDDTDLITIRGAAPATGEWGGSYVNGQSNRYNIWHGPIPDGGVRSDAMKTPIDFELTEGRLTVHYKASNQRLDLWLNDTLLLENFESATGNYDVISVQLGGGLGSFENALYDNIILGSLADNGSCGPDGPGASGIPGDFNCDGVVDVGDLGILGANFNANNVTYVDGDANLDGGVDVADLGIVGANWSAAQAVSLGQAVRNAGLGTFIPEPATIAVLTLALTCLGHRSARYRQTAKTM